MASRLVADETVGEPEDLVLVAVDQLLERAKSLVARARDQLLVGDDGRAAFGSRRRGGGHGSTVSLNSRRRSEFSQIMTSADSVVRHRACTHEPRRLWRVLAGHDGTAVTVGTPSVALPQIAVRKVHASRTGSR